MNGILALLGQVLGDVVGTMDSLLGGTNNSSTSVGTVMTDLQAAAGKAAGAADGLAASALGAIPALSMDAYGQAVNALTSAMGKSEGIFSTAMGGSAGALLAAYGEGASAAAASLAAMNAMGPTPLMSNTLSQAGLSAGQDIAQLALTMPQSVVQMTGTA